MAGLTQSGQGIWAAGLNPWVPASAQPSVAPQASMRPGDEGAPAPTDFTTQSSGQSTDVFPIPSGQLGQPLVNPGTPIPPAAGSPAAGGGAAANPALSGLLNASPSATAFDAGGAGSDILPTGPTPLRQGIGTRQGSPGASLAAAGLKRAY